MKIYFEIIDQIIDDESLSEIENIPIDKLDKYPIDVLKNIDTYIKYIDNYSYRFNKNMWFYDQHYSFLILDWRDIIIKIDNMKAPVKIIVYHTFNNLWFHRDLNYNELKYDIPIIIKSINKSLIPRRRDFKLTRIGI